MLQSPLNWLKTLFENSLTRRILRNSGYLFSATGVSAAIGMLQGILVARLLGVNDYGVLGIITLFTSVINRLLSFRMGELVIKYVGQYHEQADGERAAAVFKVSALLEVAASGVAYTLLVVLAPLAASYLAKDASYTPMFTVYGIIILFNLITESSTGLLQIFDKFQPISIFLVAQSLFTLGLITIIYFREGDLLAILIAYMVGKAIGGIGISISALVNASREWGSSWWRVPIRVLKPQARELAHFAINTNISSSISLVTKDSEILWVSLFRNPVEAGYYKLALALANISQLPVSPLPKATYPEFSREVANNRWENIRLIMRQGSYLAGGYSAIASVGLLILGRPLIRIVYGEEFLPAYPALLILLFGFLIANLLYWHRPALLALGRPDFPTKLNFILALVKVTGVLLLVPRFGYLASAALLAGYYILSSVISTIKIRSLIAGREQAS
jgi:O-antigen/teichoic acid export membrane protein